MFPDKTPAANEPMNVCISGECRNISTSSEGILEFVIPKYSGSTVLVRKWCFIYVFGDGVSINPMLLGMACLYMPS